MNFFKRILDPPRFEDNLEKTRRAEFLHYMTLTLAGILLLLILFNVLFDRFAMGVANVILFVLLLSQLLANRIIRRGYVRETSMFLLFVGWIGLTWIASRVEGVRDTAVFGYIVILIGAGFMLGWRAVTLVTVWNILAVWTLAIFEDRGLLHPVVGNPFRIALDLSTVFALISLEIFFMINTLRKSIKRSENEYAERLRVEERLINQREHLAIALAASKMETWEWNIETGAVSWSAGTEALFGMADGQFDGKYETYLSLIHPEDLPGIQHSIGRALSEKDFDYVVEHRFLWKNGEVRWLEGRGKVYRDGNGKPVRMAGTVVDITNRKHAEIERERLIRELAEKNTELEQFTYTVSHDLKAPIITIKGFLGFLGEDARSGNRERMDRDIVRISEAVDKMHRLLNELLELSRIGRMMNAPEPISFRNLIDEALDVLQGRLQSSAVQVRVTGEFPVVYGDRRRLLEVLQNLIDNAVKFSAGQSAPVVEIGCEGSENDMPVFFVRDNGIGIPAEHHERIFGLFNKLDPMAEGTGVGLALVKRIVEFHGGRIWVESEAGRGAKFLFTLPQAQGWRESGFQSI